MNPWNTYDDGWYLPLYRHVWVEAGETKKSTATSHKSALKGMEYKLSKGLPAWIVPVAHTEVFVDDDIPF